MSSLCKGLLALVCAGLAVVQAGCQDAPFCIANCDGGGGTDLHLDLGSDTTDVVTDSGDGTGTGDRRDLVTDGPDGLADVCLSLGDGLTTDNDPSNCGSCGNVCNLPHAFAKCVAGKCEVDTCQEGYNDIIKDDTNPDTAGCEYFCVPTADPTEICDGIDNDCDGTVDNGFDTQTDPMNCGGCGIVCNLAHTTQYACMQGICRSMTCEDGYVDLSPERTAGCTYQCTPTNNGVEICDGLDNDCNGLIDDGVVISQDPCCPWLSPTGDPTTACPTQVQGICRSGEQRCLGGATICFGYQGPAQADFCDSNNNAVDANCDGNIDPSLNRTITNCGGCNVHCELRPNADVSCATGQCVYTCRTSDFVNQFNEHSNRFVDRNGDLNAAQGQPSDGCECVKQQEVCDGQDNDCDGLPDQTRRANGTVVDVQSSQNFCNQKGVCAGTQPQCRAGKFVCDYGARGADVDSSGNLLSAETKCDGLDNNCDGLVDNAPAFASKNQACGVGRGVCRVNGSLACNSTGDALTCCKTVGSNGVCTTVAAEDLTQAKPETCNNRDDDCDGVIDNPGQTCDSMVQVNNPSGGSFFIDKYEASRPDAFLCSASTVQGEQTTGTACSASSPCSSGTCENGICVDATHCHPGVVEDKRACSNNLRIPWDNVTHDDAVAACTAAGKRLCTQAEWELACEGTGTPTTYPYGNAYNGTTCNGHDRSAGSDEVIQTGILASCNSSTNVRDLSGNLREWTSTLVPETRSCTVTADCKTAVSGSSYKNSAGVTCNTSAGVCQCSTSADCTAPSTCVGGRCALCQGGECAFKLRGGGFNNISTGLTCTFDSEVDFQNAALPVYGFRCCRDTAPQQANGSACP
jgi:hypothetical protein